jgi:hypothetical protein
MGRSYFPGVQSGDAVVDGFGTHLDQVMNNIARRATVTSDGAEGDTVTVEVRDYAVAPALDTFFLSDGWHDNMGIVVVWPAENTTSTVTLAVNGGTARGVVTPDGVAIAAGQLPAGLVVEFRRFNDTYVCMSPLPSSASGGQPKFFYQYTSSATFTLPGATDDNTAWNVLLWGGGGGGDTAGGGGGGACVPGWFQQSDLATDTTVTIGSGGALGAKGGSTTFGSLLTAYGGGDAAYYGSGPAGGGASLYGAGNIGSPGAPGGGIGGSSGGDAENALDIWSGGGGAIDSGNAGNAFYGGGGGAQSGTAGTSVFGGDGGTSGVAGSAPGGGGGRNAAGGRGEAWVWN